MILKAIGADLYYFVNDGKYVFIGDRKAIKEMLESFLEHLKGEE